jgi:malonyl-CoA/methylmalonyl-CoA synthetase
VERYGMTETLMNTSVRADGEPRAGTVGVPLPGVELRLVEEDGSPITAYDGETVGEIQVRGPNLFTEYLNRPDATAAALDENGWLHTGDAVAADPDGNLRMVGRLKEMFKSGGYNVYPTEIETVISTCDAVSAVAVVDVPDPLWSEVGVAFVVPAAGARVRPEDLREHARARLANYKVPKRFVVVDSLPQLPNGKADKVALREQARRLVDSYESIA